MINIPQEVKNLIKQGCGAGLHVSFPNLDHDDIYNENFDADSMSFSESICSSDDLSFGLCESSELDFTFYGIDDIRGKVLKAELAIDCSAFVQPSEPEIVTRTVSRGWGVWQYLPTSLYISTAYKNGVGIQIKTDHDLDLRFTCLNENGVSAYDDPDLDIPFNDRFNPKLYRMFHLDNTHNEWVTINLDNLIGKNDIFDNKTINFYAVPLDDADSAEISVKTYSAVDNSPVGTLKSDKYPFCYYYPIPLGEFVVDKCEKESGPDEARKVTSFSKIFNGGDSWDALEMKKRSIIVTSKTTYDYDPVQLALAPFLGDTIYGEEQGEYYDIDESLEPEIGYSTEHSRHILIDGTEIVLTYYRSLLSVPLGKDYDINSLLYFVNKGPLTKNIDEVLTDLNYNGIDISIIKNELVRIMSKVFVGINTTVILQDSAYVYTYFTGTIKNNSDKNIGMSVPYSFRLNYYKNGELLISKNSTFRNTNAIEYKTFSIQGLGYHDPIKLPRLKVKTGQYMCPYTEGYSPKELLSAILELDASFGRPGRDGGLKIVNLASKFNPPEDDDEGLEETDPVDIHDDVLTRDDYISADYAGKMTLPYGNIIASYTDTTGESSYALYEIPKAEEKYISEVKDSHILLSSDDGTWSKDVFSLYTKTEYKGKEYCIKLSDDITDEQIEEDLIWVSVAGWISSGMIYEIPVTYHGHGLFAFTFPNGAISNLTSLYCRTDFGRNLSQYEGKLIRFGPTADRVEYYDDNESLYYDLSNNAIISNSVYTDESIQVVLRDFANNLKNVRFLPASIQAPGYAYLEAGDLLSFEAAEGQYYDFLIEKRDFSGIQASSDKFEAMGDNSLGAQSQSTSGGGQGGTGPVDIGDGLLTIKYGNTTIGSFTANQTSSSDANIPLPNDGTLTIKHGNETLATFTANQSGNAVANIPVVDISECYKTTDSIASSLLDDEDEYPVNKNTGSNVYEKQKIKFSTLKSTLKAYFDSLYSFVVGNPASAGTERLSRIYINGTTYNIPSGGGDTTDCYKTTDTEYTSDIAIDDYIPIARWQLGVTSLDKRKIKFNTFRNTLKSYFDTLYSKVTANPGGASQDLTSIDINGTKYNISGGGGGGTSTLELLWTNPNPSSNFSAQTVSLDLSNYDLIVIESSTTTTSSRLFMTLCRNGTGAQLQRIGTSYFYIRSLDITNTGVSFETGQRVQALSGTWASNSGYIIPQKIYGVHKITGANNFIDLVANISNNTATITDSTIGTATDFQFFTDAPGQAPTGVNVSGNTMTISFNNTTATQVKVRCWL